MINISLGEEITADTLVCLLYGDPGVGKTTTALTSMNPILFDFDGGVHRSEFRSGKAIVRMKGWDAMVASYKQLDTLLAPYDTVIVDTVDAALDYMKAYLETQNFKDAKNQFRIYGKLKEAWHDFLFRLRAMNKDIILLAHGVTEEVNGVMKTTPKITGGSKDIVWQKTDIAGYMSTVNNKRTITFSSTDFYTLKNPGKLQPTVVVPEYTDEPLYLHGILEKSKANINAASASQQNAMAFLAQQKQNIASAISVVDINTIFDSIKVLESKMIRSQLWTMLKEKATALGYTFNATEKVFEVQ